MGSFLGQRNVLNQTVVMDAHICECTRPTELGELHDIQTQLLEGERVSMGAAWQSPTGWRHLEFSPHRPRICNLLPGQKRSLRPGGVKTSRSGKGPLASSSLAPFPWAHTVVLGHPSPPAWPGLEGELTGQVSVLPRPGWS